MPGDCRVPTLFIVDITVTYLLLYCTSQLLSAVSLKHSM